MERIILWEINSTSLQVNPLSTNQHAFRAGRSTETALTSMVSKVENAICNGKYALCVFLDIQGAFDNVSPEAVLRGMENKGISDRFCRWYEHYLMNRTITVKHNGVTLHRSLTLGTPQGGVLSPVMWNLAFESYLELFQGSLIHVDEFVDDAALLLVGHNPNLNGETNIDWFSEPPKQR